MITLRHTTVGRTPLDSDQPDAEICTWQHTTLTTERHPCHRRDSNPQSPQASGRRTTFWPRGHWDRLQCWLAEENCRSLNKATSNVMWNRVFVVKKPASNCLSHYMDLLIAVGIKKNVKISYRLTFNPLNAELNPICHLLVLVGDLTFMGPCIVSVF
jgi:hypothetical protein